MSQAVITQAFVEWKAQQATDNQPVTLDEFIFAYVPNLDDSVPIENTETIPEADKIVYRQAVSKTGVVNANAVVYSVTLGADIGDFDFNWIGLVNQASGTLAMIIHAPTQRKIKNASGQQGNVLVRSMLMEYSGAESATHITTPAETWQIDFTARLAGMDERQRVENTDIYGTAAFFTDGFLVKRVGSAFSIMAGVGYVAGLRAELSVDQPLIVTTKPVKVWLDVSWRGTLTSTWQVEQNITVAASLANYEQNGRTHYVFAVASIDVDGVVADLRPTGALSDQAFTDALKKHEQSRHHPDATTTATGFTQLSSDTNSNSESMAATPRAIKTVNDNANGKLAKSQNGADIQDKSRFIENMGLNNTVNQAANAVQKSGDIMTGPLVSTDGNAFRLKQGNQSFFFRFDGSNFYLLVTNPGDPDGSWNSFRPFAVNAASGEVALGAQTKINGDLIIGNVGSRIGQDGNICGTVWGGWLNEWLATQFNARDIGINNRATVDWVYQNFVNDIRLVSRGQIVTDGAMTEAPAGAVITGGNGNEGNQAGYMYYRYLQKLVHGNWFTVAYA